MNQWIESLAETTEMQKIEQEFRAFVRRLLAVQEYDWSEEHKLFTPESLQKILIKFCSIIANELKVESCTVNLQLYNPELLKQKVKQVGAEDGFLEDPIADSWINEYYRFRWKNTDSKEPEIDKKWKYHKNQVYKTLKSPMTFPFWKHYKGVSILFAANGSSNDHDMKHNSPWYAILEKADLKDVGIAPLSSGISKEIYQDNIAKISDRFTIRSTRCYHKMGGADRYVWTNERWERVFRNYYGAPIRIHPNGEVIGILKVENKMLDERDLWIYKEINNRHINFETLKNTIIRQNLFINPTINRLTLSFFSMVYFELEIILTNNKLNHIPRSTIFTPLLKRNKSSHDLSLANNGKRPPVQFFFDSIEKEQEVYCLMGFNNLAPKNVTNLCRSIKKIYTTLNHQAQAIFSSLPAEKHPIIIDLPELKIKIALKKPSESKRPDFFFDATIQDRTGDKEIPCKIEFPPINSQEIRSFLSWLKKDEEVIQDYLDLNKDWFSSKSTSEYIPLEFATIKTSETQIKSICRHAEFFEVKKDGKKYFVTDFVLDRLVARTQSFLFSIPIPEFKMEDAQKLGWAAYEIGKLIEREISYHANRSSDPMPLTAMEFYRIPISDLSFVDDLRKRRRSIENTKGNLDVYLNNLITDMHMNDSGVNYSSRIKEYRSYFQRIGERFEGHVRGNLAIWVYLLSILKKRLRLNHPIFEKMLPNLDNSSAFHSKKESFGSALDAFNDQVGQAISTFFSENRLLDFSKIGFEYYKGDLRFDAPPFKYSSEKHAIKQSIRILAYNICKELYPKIPDLDKDKAETLINDDLSDIIYRNYNNFIRDSVSLFIQLKNIVEQSEVPYKEFYRTCWEIRNILCTTISDISEDPKRRCIAYIFGIGAKNDGKDDRELLANRERWKKIVAFLENTENSTKEILSDQNPNTVLDISLLGIYKRLRTLVNTLKHQRSAAILDWELGRFDLYGGRVNCLYKNQVFAMYEYLWNRGDPFVQYRFPEELATIDEFVSDHDQNSLHEPSQSESRQRWLCLRTTNQHGAYNALQIAALFDPAATNFGYWSESHYNLVKVRKLLGTLFTKYDKNSLSKYKAYAFHREKMRKHFLKWYQVALGVKNHQPYYAKETDESKWLGTFLFEGAIDLLMVIIKCKILSLTANGKAPFGFTADIFSKIDMAIFINTPNSGLFVDLFERIAILLKNAEQNSSEIRSAWTNENELDKSCIYNCYTPCSKKNLAKKTSESNRWDCCGQRKCIIYENAIKLLKEIKKLKLNKNDQKILSKIESNLIAEHRYFKLQAKQYYMPLFYFNPQWRDSSGEDLKSNIEHIVKNLNKSLNKSKKAKGGKGYAINNLSISLDQNYWYFIFRTLKHLRQEQRSFLFDDGDPELALAEAGLWRRNKDEVFNRIKNYSLLFDETEYSPDNHFKYWSAHDLYYYLRSLIPIEIQVRTELSDTFAEQYHDPVYKAHPPLGTELPRTLMDTIGERLDSIDREMEIDYEDYVLRYRLNDSENN